MEIRSAKEKAGQELPQHHRHKTVNQKGNGKLIVKGCLRGLDVSSSNFRYRKSFLCPPQK